MNPQMHTNTKESVGLAIEKIIQSRMRSIRFSTLMLIAVSIFDLGVIFQGHRYAVLFLFFMALNTYAVYLNSVALRRWQYDLYMVNLQRTGKMKAYTRGS